MKDSGAGDDCVGVRATFAVISGFGAAINFKPDWSIADHFADSADFFHLAFSERLSAESWIGRQHQDEIEIVWHIFEARLIRRALSSNAMMGERRAMQEALFYGLNIERHAPSHHLLLEIDPFAQGRDDGILLDA